MNDLSRHSQMAQAIAQSQQALSNERDALRLLYLQNHRPEITIGDYGHANYRWLYFDPDTEMYKAGRQMPGFKPEEHRFEGFTAALDWMLA